VTCLSAIHFRGRFIRQVSCYTLLSGCRLPWPPSCCLNESTPFVGSSEHAFWHLNLCVWFIPHRHSCLPGLAHLGFAPLEGGRFNKETPLLYTRLKFENKSRVNPPLRLLIIRFTRCNCCANPSNPEGNFGRNQLLDDSMGLSPLYPGLTNDLHVSIAADFHQGFPWLYPPRA
jgi:hypothetical protein